MPRRPFRLDTPQGRTLDGLLDLPEGAGGGPLPTVVVCHGFKGFMEWGFFPYAAELLADRGFLAVRFNLSGAGMRPGEDRVADLDAFRDDTYSRELEDLRSVLAGLGEITGGAADPGRVGLLGHSRGGAAALLAAAGPPPGGAEPTPAALVTWSAIAEVDRWDRAAKAAWRRDGVLRVENSRTGQVLPLGPGLLADVEEHRGRLDLLAAAGRRTAPWLIVHARDDESVPFAEGERLAEAASGGGPVERLAVDSGGHTFGSKHPFQGPTPPLIEALNATQRWFRRHLGS